MTCRGSRPAIVGTAHELYESSDHHRVLRTQSNPSSAFVKSTRRTGLRRKDRGRSSAEYEVRAEQSRPRKKTSHLRKLPDVLVGVPSGKFRSQYECKPDCPETLSSRHDALFSVPQGFPRPSQIVKLLDSGRNGPLKACRRFGVAEPSFVSLLLLGTPLRLSVQTGNAAPSTIAIPSWWIPVIRRHLRTLRISRPGNPFSCEFYNLFPLLALLRLRYVQPRLPKPVP